MNREETLAWIDIILDTIDRQDMLAIIKESREDFDGQFFETIDSEVQRYKAEGNQAAAERLSRVARTAAALRQNLIENL